MSTITRIVRRAAWSKTLFEFWQSLGVNVTRKHFYSPIPDTKELAEKNELWRKEPQLVSIDMNQQSQLCLLEEVFTQYKSEFNFVINKTDNPHEFYLNNGGFGLEDAEVLHCMIRHFKPKTIIEVGAGHSTFLSARACLMNQKEGCPGRLISIEPYPREAHKKGFPGLDRLIIQKVEELEANFFEQLAENDILFIDSSHVVRIGNDVNFLYLEVLPRLKKGVIVHIHDIFFPYHYPKEWVVDKLIFYTEQYLLQAFLCLNRAYEVVFGNYYMLSKYLDKMHAVFAHPQGYRQRNIPNSFWIRKTN
jgi:predicted O-methyltransferase YrrM